MKWHEFFNVILTGQTFRMASFLFFIIFYLAMVPYNVPPQLAVAFLAGISECCLWVLPVPFPRNVSFAAFFPLQLQDASYRLSPSIFKKDLSVTSCFSFIFKLILNHSLYIHLCPTLSSITQQPTFWIPQCTCVSMVKGVWSSFLVALQIWMA